MTAHGHVHWNELNTRDAEKAKSFYGTAMGWTFDRMEMGDDAPYWICKDGDQVIGGIFTMSGAAFDGVPDHWLTHFAVADIDMAVAQAKKDGGEILKEPWDLPEIGRIAIVRDPGGAVTGWMTPAPTN